jgi:arsenate reductase-like glutaredoxin family protein
MIKNTLHVDEDNQIDVISEKDNGLSREELNQSLRDLEQRMNQKISKIQQDQEELKKLIENYA